MRNMNIDTMCRYTEGKLHCQDGNNVLSGICTDSRKWETGQVFFALKGEVQDGHAYIESVYDKGCRAFVVSQADAMRFLKDKGDTDVIRAESTNEALRKLTKNYLKEFEIKKIGVTGSTGKTTTKDMLYYICSEKYKTAVNKGNLNTDVGLAMTVLDMEEGTEVGVFEMGMSAMGEIDILAGIVNPQIGVITNIGTSHLEHLKTRENILKTKMEITNYFDENSSLVVNEINDLLTEENTKGVYKRISVGEDDKCQYVIKDLKDKGEYGISYVVEHEGKSFGFDLPTPGRHNAINATLAVAAAMEIGISMEEAAKGLSKMKLTDKRLNIIEKNGIKIIDDTYNASPDSMKAGIDVLMSVKGKRKVAVLADILEMGEDGWKYHREIGKYAGIKGVNLLITTGKLGYEIAEGAKGTENQGEVMHFENKEKLLEEINNMLMDGDVVLVKGSRGMAMDTAVKKILE